MTTAEAVTDHERLKQHKNEFQSANTERKQQQQTSKNSERKKTRQGTHTKMICLDNKQLDWIYAIKTVLSSNDNTESIKQYSGVQAGALQANRCNQSWKQQP